MTAEAPVVSVVVSLYNAEAYLSECIDSVRACEEDAIECILVNDGSTDGSRDICSSAVTADKRFTLIDKENSGVSDSRNIGMSAARGKYVFFLDADDYIDPAQWPQILYYARESVYDFVAFAYCSLFPSGREQEELFRMDGTASADPADTLFALLASPMLNTCWGKLLRRSVIEECGLRFDTSLVTCEDAVFVIDFIDSARTFLLCNQCVLHYRIHKSSATRMRPLADKLEDFGVLYSRRVDFLQSHPEFSLSGVSHRESFSVITNMLLEYTAGHSLGDARETCRLILASSVTSRILSNMTPGGITPFYKRLEFELMRSSAILPLSIYFKAKSFLMQK